MKTIALVTLKGGMGKSTLAVNLAVCAARQGKKVALIDLDPQASVQYWASLRAREDVPVLAAQVEELTALLASARKQGTDIVVIDTAGLSRAMPSHVIKTADLVLVPSRMWRYDFDTSLRAAGLIAHAGGKHAAFVLNAVPPRGDGAREARETLKFMLPVSPVELHQRAAYSSAFNQGLSVEELEPAGKAAQEIRALYDWTVNLAA